jgi:hypothetical protein
MPDQDLIDVNFSTKLAIWDWLFGTAHLPAGKKPAGYGLVGEDVAPRGYLPELAAAFQRIRVPELAADLAISPNGGERCSVLDHAASARVVSDGRAPRRSLLAHGHGKRGD